MRFLSIVTVSTNERGRGRLRSSGPFFRYAAKPVKWILFSALPAALLAAPARAEPAFGAFMLNGISLAGDNSVYTYDRGEVLSGGRQVSGARAEKARRLALFWRSLSEAPFFFSPGLEQEFLPAVKRLGEEEKALLVAMRLRETVYPLEFLSAYARSSALFREFSESRSEAAADQLLAAMRAAVGAYAKEASRSSALVVKYYPKDKDRIYGGGAQTFTGLKTFLTDAALIRGNAAEARRRLAGLEKCLRGKGPCGPAWRPAPWQEPAGALPDPAEIIPAGDLGLSSGAYRGPYLVAAPCWDGKAQNYVYYGERPGPGGAPMEWDAPASDVLFTPVSPENARAPLLAAKGLAFLPNNMASPYACNDLRFKPALQALDSLYLLVSSAPLAGALAPYSGAGEAVAAAERALAGEALPSQGAMERLGRAYYGAATELDGLPGNLREELLARSLRVLVRTDGLWRILNRLTYHMRHFRTARTGSPRARNRGYEGVALYIARGHASIFFMPFSGSVWMLEEQPRLLDGYDERNGRGVVHYREAVKLYGRQQVLDAMTVTLAGVND